MALALPRVLWRAPYRQSNPSANRFFTETIRTRSDYLWGNAAYVYAHRLLQTFEDQRWFVPLASETKEAEKVTALARFAFQGEQLHHMAQQATELALHPEQAQQLRRWGLLVLMDDPRQQQARFITPRSLAEGLQGRLEVLLSCCRFAHYLKVMMRTKIGGFTTVQQLQSNLQRWLARYCADHHGQPRELMTPYPLLQAQLQIQVHPPYLDRYQGTLAIQPYLPEEDKGDQRWLHFQLHVINTATL
jgi:type VI secretion system protein ImpC